MPYCTCQILNPKFSQSVRNTGGYWMHVQNKNLGKCTKTWGERQNRKHAQRQMIRQIDIIRQSKNQEISGVASGWNENLSPL